jgi:hypothetical protein
MRVVRLLETGVIAVAVLTACAIQILPTPQGEIPFGGDRASILPRDLEAARDHLAGGLVEPSWLPDDFRLVFVFSSSFEQASDLRYEGDEHYVQIFQAHRGPAELGPKEPFDYGDRSPIGDEVEWHAGSLAIDPEATEYSARMPDGRSVSVASNLDPATIQRILDSLYVRPASADS